MQYDVVIIGAGPVGLGFACAMIDSNLKVLVVEKSSNNKIQNPAQDGREIALTHASVKILKKMQVWDIIDKKQISLLKEAKVFDGNSNSLLNFSTKNSSIEALGYLVPNYQIRQALYKIVATANNIDFIYNSKVVDVNCDDNFSNIVLEDNTIVKTKLLVAADSRFSDMRNKMGIASSIQDFSKMMIVVKMRHEFEHNHTALERFDYGQTIALLPMPGNISSVVITVATDKQKTINDMSCEDFNHMVAKAFKFELGAMSQIGERHSYPLVAVHAQKFIAKRFALIGDAAVGMHPVTAHGFNLGLRGQDILANLVKDASLNAQDIGATSLLKAFEDKQINLTRIMFLGTNVIVSLFTNDASYAKPIRRLVLKVAEHFPPVKYLIKRQLTGSGKNSFLPFL